MDHLFNRTVKIRKQIVDSDGRGGSRVTYTNLSDAFDWLCRKGRPSKRLQFDNIGATVQNIVYYNGELNDNISVGDRLVDEGVEYRIIPREAEGMEDAHHLVVEATRIGST